MASISSSADAKAPGADPEAAAITGDWKRAFDNAVFKEYEARQTGHDPVPRTVYTVCNFPAWSRRLDLVEYLLIASSLNFG